MKLSFIFTMEVSVAKTENKISRVLPDPPLS